MGAHSHTCVFCSAAAVSQEMCRSGNLKVPNESSPVTALLPQPLGAADSEAVTGPSLAAGGSSQHLPSGLIGEAVFSAMSSAWTHPPLGT